MAMNALEKRFNEMGARVKVVAQGARAWSQRARGGGIAIDIKKDVEGPYFEIRTSGSISEADLTVVDCKPKDRHLLLQAVIEGEKNKYLCGHDERDWFVAAVPGRPSGVKEAMEALKPREVQQAVRLAGVKEKDKNKRRNDAFLRQGEWFFIPANDADLGNLPVLKNEPIRRGRGKPHMCQELVRRGGTTVYVSAKHPNGLTQESYDKLTDEQRNSQAWQVMRRDAEVYVRGRITHPDHKTIVLQGWHRVIMNTETRAAAMRHVAFLD